VCAGGRRPSAALLVLSDDAHAGVTRSRLAEIVDGTPPGMLSL
jgi:hypothetical protein